MGEAQDFEQRLKEVADRVTVALDQLIPPAGGPEADLMRAMRHAALANGKRMRPFFLLETGAMFDAPEKTLLRAAAASERPSFGPWRRWLCRPTSTARTARARGASTIPTSA